MNLHNKHIRVILFAILIVSGLPIATKGDDQTVVEVEFSAIAVNRYMPFSVYFEASEGEFEKIDFHPRRRSSLFTFEGEGAIHFYDEYPTKNTQTGEIIRPRPFASVPTEELYDKSLLIFWNDSIPEHSNRTNYISVLDDSETGFPYGHFVIVNACGAELVGRIGNTNHNISNTITEPFFTRYMRDENNRIRLAFAVQIQDNYELVYANELELSTDVRSIIVLRPPRRPGSIRITAHTINESR